MSDSPKSSGDFHVDQKAASLSEMLERLEIDVDADLAAKSMVDGRSAERYQVDDTLNEGDEQLLLATDITCERKVHIRVPAKAATTESVARFVERTRLLRQLAHPVIPPIIDIGVDRSGRPFAVTPATNGRTLAEILHASKTGDVTMQRRYSLPRLLDLFVQICDGMAHAHRQGVIHLNLNPNDIFIGDDGEVAITNWRHARAATLFADDHDAMPNSGRGDWKVETAEIQQPDSDLALAYLAPEQVLGRAQDIRLWTDIYALGGVLYYMITLRPPVEAETPEELIKKVARGEISDPSLYSAQRALVAEMGRSRKGPDANRHYSAHKQIPESLSAVVMKALAPRPVGRYVSAQELRKEIDSHRDGQATREEEVTFQRESVEVLGQHQFRNRLIWAVVFLVAMVLVVLFGLSAHEMVQLQERFEQAEAARIAAERQTEELKDQLAVKPKPMPNIEAMLWDASSDESKLWRTAENALLGAIRMDKESWRARYELGKVYLTQLDPKAARLQFELARTYVSPYELEQVASIKSYIAIANALERHLAGETTLPADAAIAPAVTEPEKPPEPIADDPIMFKLREAKAKLEAANPGVQLPRRFFSIGDNSVHILIEEQPLTDITALADLPITSLSLWKTGITDLSAIKDLPLKILSLSQSKVKDISALRGMPLETLDLDDSAVSDLSPLQGMKLQSLQLNGSKVSDISALRGMPLKSLALSQTNVSDISPLAGMELRGLGLNGTAVSDLSVLRGMPLEVLGLSGTPIRSVDDLQALPIVQLDLSGTAITSIAALVGMPLKHLQLSGCAQLTDLKLLTGCPKLERLSVPGHIANLIYLRKLPNLQRIDTEHALTDAKEFWREYVQEAP